MARVILKPLAKQAVVLTGGTSGIGLTTARMLARRGAKLFLIARNEEALRTVCEEIRAGGGEAQYAVADVADKFELESAALKVVEAFGGYAHGSTMRVHSFTDATREMHRETVQLRTQAATVTRTDPVTIAGTVPPNSPSNERKPQ